MVASAGRARLHQEFCRVSAPVMVDSREDSSELEARAAT
jgi:hypothetical protein